MPPNYYLLCSIWRRRGWKISKRRAVNTRTESLIKRECNSSSKETIIISLTWPLDKTKSTRELPDQIWLKGRSPFPSTSIKFSSPIRSLTISIGSDTSRKSTNSWWRLYRTQQISRRCRRCCWILSSGDTPPKPTLAVQLSVEEY